MGNCAGIGSWIESKTECEAAAKSLGLPDDTAGAAFTTTENTEPYGCYYKKSQKGLWWNPMGGKVNDDTDRVSVCRKAGQFGIVQCHLSIVPLDDALSCYGPGAFFFV